MLDKTKTKYPIYILSKGRYERCYTAIRLIEFGIHFYLVVEPQEYDEYHKRYNHDCCKIIVLPEGHYGMGAIPVRNWIWSHSIGGGQGRHWQLDDNILRFERWYKGLRIKCNPILALWACERFTDKYENIGISGLNYHKFAITKRPPFVVNVHVYSCMLIDNSMNIRWRGKWNADTDLCLQVLGIGLCTVLINAYLADKQTTMTSGGGNTARYKKMDGRLKMAEALRKAWPGIVTIKRRFGRPQHVIDWARFKTPLIRKKDIDIKERILPSLKIKKEIKHDKLKNKLHGYENPR